MINKYLSIIYYIMTNSWIDYLKKKSKELNKPYNEVMKMPKVRQDYNLHIKGPKIGQETKKYTKSKKSRFEPIKIDSKSDYINDKFIRMKKMKKRNFLINLNKKIREKGEKLDSFFYEIIDKDYLENYKGYPVSIVSKEVKRGAGEIEEKDFKETSKKGNRNSIDGIIENVNLLEVKFFDVNKEKLITFNREDLNISSSDLETSKGLVFIIKVIDIQGVIDYIEGKKKKGTKLGFKDDIFKEQTMDEHIKKINERIKKINIERKKQGLEEEPYIEYPTRSQLINPKEYLQGLKSCKTEPKLMTKDMFPCKVKTGRFDTPEELYEHYLNAYNKSKRPGVKNAYKKKLNKLKKIIDDK